MFLSSYQSSAVSPAKRQLSQFASQLPQLDTICSRLRTCARRASTVRWPECRGIAFQVRLDDATPTVDREIYVDIRTAWGSVGLAISSEQWPSLASAAMLQDHSQRSALALILLQHFLKSSDGFLKSVNLSFDIPPDLSCQNIEFHFQEACARFLFACDDMLNRVEQDLTQAIRQRPISARGLSLQSNIFLTTRKMSFGWLRKLAHGDVVLIPAPPIDTAMACTAFCDWGETRRGRIQMKVLLQNNAMTILKKPSVKSIEHFDENIGLTLDSPHLDHGDSPIDLASMDLEDLSEDLKSLQFNINFLLPGPTCSLSDIAAMTNDEVLELPMHVDEAHVRIFIAGQCIGKGELLAVGSRLGVRILHIDLDRRESNKP